MLSATGMKMSKLYLIQCSWELGRGQSHVEEIENEFKKLTPDQKGKTFLIILQNEFNSLLVEKLDITAHSFIAMS